MINNTFDLIVFGATSFVGQIICKYLNDSEFTQDVRWAMAGRSIEKLKRVKQDTCFGFSV